MQNLQGLRAGACLLVVIYHALQYGVGEGFIARWPNASAGIDVFFVLSGFVMSLSVADLPPCRQTAQKFLTARLMRIVPLYWALTAAKLLTMAVLPNAAPHTHPTLANIVASFLFVPWPDAQNQIRPVLAVGWTLNTEMFFYALIAASLAVKCQPLRIVPPLLLLGACAGLWHTATWPAPLSLLHGYLAEFALGMAVYALWHKQKLQNLPAPIIALAGAIALLVLPHAGAARCLVWGLPAALLLMAALARDDAHKKLPRIILVLGDASYAIYLLHGFLVPSLGPIFGAVLSLPAGILLDRFIDRPLRHKFTPVPA
jgi:peptidoglycan/LPS O-acetylase OafA/YrhL